MFLAQAVNLLEGAARLSLPSSGWGFLYAWQHAAFTDLLGAVDALVTRWTQRLADFNQTLIAYDALPHTTREVDRVVALQAADLMVSSQLDSVLTTSALLRPALPGKGAAMQARLAQLPDDSIQHFSVIRQRVLIHHRAFDRRIRPATFQCGFNRRSSHHSDSKIYRVLLPANSRVRTRGSPPSMRSTPRMPHPRLRIGETRVAALTAAARRRCWGTISKSFQSSRFPRGRKARSGPMH